MKYLFWAIVIAFVWWAWRRSRSAAANQQPPAAPTTQDMVTCAHCGVHLPRSEALTAGGHSYCSAAHRDAGPRADA